MTVRHCWTALWSVCFCVMLSTGAALAGSPQIAQLGPNGAPGVVRAVSFGPLPDAAAVTILAEEDDDLNNQIKDLLLRELAAEDRTVAADAPLELLFRSGQVESVVEGQRPSLGRLEAGTDRGVDFRMNVWSTNEDSVLGGRRQRQAGSRTNVFQISLTLRDRQTGKTLWQGDSYCEMLTGDKLRLSRSMLPPLVSQIGQTVKDAPFEIQ